MEEKMSEYPENLPNGAKVENNDVSQQSQPKKIRNFTGNITPIAESDEPPTKSKKKYTKTQWITFITMSFGNFCVGACLSLQAPFFPQEAEQKGATPTEYGFIFGMFQLTIFIAAPLMGKLVGYIEAKRMLNVGIFTTGLTCVFFGFLDYIPGRAAFVALAFVIRAVEGIGAAALRTSCYAIIAAQFPDNMTTIFASIETFLGIGLIIGPTLGGALYDLGGFGLPFFVVGALVLVDAVVIFLVLPKPESSKNAKMGQLLKFWLHPSTLIYAATIFTTFCYLGYNQATLEPHVRDFKLSGIYLGLLFGIPGACYAVSAPFFGWLCDNKCNLQLVATCGYLLIISSLILIGPMPFLNLEPQIEIVITSLILLGFGVGSKIVPSFTGSLRDTVTRGFPEDISTYALISSMIASSQSLGSFIGPSVGGMLLEKTGYNTGTIVILIIEVISLTFLLAYSLICKRFLLTSSLPPEQRSLLGGRHSSPRARTQSEIASFQCSIHSTL